MERASRALGGGDPAPKLYELAVGLGAEMSLGKLGMPKDGVAKAAALAVANPYPNPRPITEEGLVPLLSRAVEGLPPITPLTKAGSWKHAKTGSATRRERVCPYE